MKKWKVFQTTNRLMMDFAARYAWLPSLQEGSKSFPHEISHEFPMYILKNGNLLGDTFHGFMAIKMC